MDDKTLVERQMVAGDIHAGTYADLNRQIAALQSRIEALEAALRGMCEAYKLVCDDAGVPYYTSPVSKYASAIKLLEGKSNG